jgi:hypothetical protein
MERLDTVHTFLARKEREGHVVLLFRRIDTHAVAAVGSLALVDKDADVETLGREVCEMLNRELATRGAKAE